MEQQQTPQVTNQELLRKVIEAQVMGGCEKWDDMFALAPDEWEIFWSEPCPILEILLDTDGCKAAFMDEKCKDGADCENCQRVLAVVCPKIVRAWHSGSGNNVRAALEAAVSFLP